MSMAVSLRRHTNDDAELARRAAQGDDAAFAALDDRYRRPLIRYARSLLRRSEHDAEDVVQDVLLRAGMALRAGEGPDELRPWLYRLTRNRAIDEVRRARWGDAALEADALALEDVSGSPEMVLNRRENVRRLVEDLAELPVAQRTALLARELDGKSADAVAAELGVTPAAAQMLAVRARSNLVKSRAARDADCGDVRRSLAEAHERGVRPSEHVRRHLAGCTLCRAYKRDLERLARRLHLLSPPIALAPLAALAKLFGGGGATAGKGVAAGVAVVAVAATGGVAVLATDLFSSDDPAPFQLKGIKALVGSDVKAGDPVPRGTAVVTARVRLAPGDPQARRSVTLDCPAGMRVAGLAAPEQRVPLSYYGLSDSTIIGHSRRATIVFARGRLTQPATATVGALCRKPGPTGSLARSPRALRPGETAARVCADRSYVYRSPGRLFVGTVFRDQPVAVQRRSASGKWVRIAPDLGQPGWVRAAVLC